MSYHLKSKKWLRSSLAALVLVLLLASCKTIEIRTEYMVPDLTAFRPSEEPLDLIAEPQTDVDLMHNSIEWEYWGLDWKRYALGYENFEVK